MSEEFSFNARQYFDFSKNQEDLDGDSFFEKVAEDELPQGTAVEETITSNGGVTESEIIELSDTESDSVFFSPMTGAGSGGASASTIYLKTKMRRSLSMSNLPTDNKPVELQQAMDNLNLVERPSSSCSHNSKRAPSQEHINRLAQPKRYTSAGNVNRTGSMTLAEAVKKFQAGTPKRFRTKASPKINKTVAPLPWGGTRAHSPKLLTTQRARTANTNVLSHEEREKLEMEEAKKFKIRAHPVNKKVMRGPVKPPVEKKPPTTIEPFNLTEVKKKDSMEVTKIPSFKAQPVPKTLHNPFKLQETAQPTTKPQTPSFVKKLHRSLPKLNNTTEKVDTAPKQVKLTRTQPMPFSFETRDKQIQKKKEEMINKVLEEEKKAREFHARPPPKAILRSRNRSLDTMSEASSTRSHKNGNEEMNTTTTFKAKPPTVLYIKPFEPKKDEDHDLKIEPFQLTTDQRIQARHEFELQLKEREMIKEALKKEMEELERKRQEEEVAKLRKQAEYKAQPIKKYKEIKIEKSNKITNPISPVFHTSRLRNKENIQH